MRHWLRLAGDRRLKGAAPLHEFLEFALSRANESQAQAGYMGRKEISFTNKISSTDSSAHEGDDVVPIVGAWRTLSACRTLDVNDVSESVILRPFYQHSGPARQLLRVGGELEVMGRRSARKIMDEHFPGMTSAEFSNVQLQVDDSIGLRLDDVFAINRFNDDDFTFLMRRVLWASPEDGLPLSQLDSELKRLWTVGKPGTLPPLPYRCTSNIDVLNTSTLVDFYFVSDRDQTLHYFNWDAALRDVIRNMPTQGLPGHSFRRQVLALHPHLAHSKEHGSWRSIMERMLLRYDDLVSISTARTDGVTNIVRKILPWQLPPPATAVPPPAGSGAKKGSSSQSAATAAIGNASPTSVTSEAVHVLALMGSLDSSLRGGGSSSKWISFDEVAKCLSADALAKLESIGKSPDLQHRASGSSSNVEQGFSSETTASSIAAERHAAVKGNANAETNMLSTSTVFQLLQYNRYLDTDIRMLVRETRSSNSCVVLLDAAAIKGGGNVSERVQQTLLKASAAAPHARIISARKKGDPIYSPEDVITPPWMPNSVALLAQLAKHLARSNATTTTTNSASVSAPVPAAQQLKTVYVIVPDDGSSGAAAKEALAEEIRQLAGEELDVQFLSCQSQ